MNKPTALILALLLLTVRQAADAAKPNVLFIIADDLGWGDLRCYGNPVIDTPTLDELAKVGVRFTDHYQRSREQEILLTSFREEDVLVDSAGFTNVRIASTRKALAIVSIIYERVEGIGPDL